MKNIACWQSDEAFAIINPDADAVPDHVFRAVHSDVNLQIRTRRNTPPTVVRPEAFLKRFLEPTDHVIVPVIGDSGTGKSHLIRWMQLRIPSDSQRRVLFVPKAQTNLREIVRSLIAELPEGERATFTAALQVAGADLLGKNAQRGALLNNLQLALQNDQVNRQSGIDPRVEAYLLEGLRAVFLDVYLRDTVLLSDGSFAADLAQHVFERPEKYQPAEQRRLFRTSDLPLDVKGLAKAAARTREFLSYLLASDDATKAAAVAIVNRNLDWAIARCLNISGDRLIELMLGIRRRLKSENKALILLIEDFARLQGLDRALLQSLIEQRQDLCVLRTAFASTTGFYDTVAETVLTRLTFVVDMTVPLSDEGQGIDLATFSARYMNALRLGEAKLKDGLDKSTGKNGAFSVENACDSCPHQGECHGLFGHADGFGLYPFTHNALRLMSERADPDARSKFNPREFQKAVLRPVALAAPALAAGGFPPPSLLESLGGIKRLTPAEQNKLRSADAANVHRRIALLELWDGEGQARDLAIQEAFSLPTLGLKKQPIGSEQTPASPPKSAPQTTKPTDPQPPQRVVELRAWFNNQGNLSAPTANALRQLLFRAIDEAIDWDSVGLAQSAFRGSGAPGTRPFVPSSIYFLKQSTNRVPNIVQIDIPKNWDDETERYQTVMALEGLVEGEQSGGWDFKDGVDKFACLQECLARWSSEVVRQLRDADNAGADWDPADCALSIRVALGLLTTEGASIRSDLDVVQMGLAALVPPRPFATGALNSLLKDIGDRNDQLLEVINSRRSAMKGGSPGNFMDTQRLLRSVGPLRKNNFIPTTPPGKISQTTSVEQLATLARKVASQLPNLVQEEAKSRRQWLKEMESAFGEELRKETILQATDGLVEELAKMGLTGVNELGAARHAFQNCEFDKAIRSARDLPAEDASIRLNHLWPGIGFEIEEARQFSKALSTALTRAETHVASMLRNSGIELGRDKRIREEINADLQRIGGFLERVPNA